MERNVDKMIKSVALQIEVHKKLLAMRHKFEEEQGRIIGFSEVIEILIDRNNGDGDADGSSGNN